MSDQLQPATDTTAAATVTDPVAKSFVTLQAALAIAGWALHRLAHVDGQPEFLATRWDGSRELQDLAAVAAFAAQIGIRL